MKFLLKGKEYLSKKLQQLDIATDNLDIIDEQIPARLKQPLRVLLNNQIDLEDNQKYQTYFKNYPNHHISHFLLQKYISTANSTHIPKHYNLPQQKQDLFIPNYNQQLERKALILKQVVDQYDQGYHKINSPIVCMSVIHFHHKRGAQVQYIYPSQVGVSNIDNLIVHHAMPDSSHNKMQDYNFFNFQAVVNNKKRMLFGVSYFKQIKVTEQMKAKNSQITRSYLQKALTVVSTLPIFGYLKLRLNSVIKLFFAQHDNFTLINSAYHQLNKGLSESWPNMDMNQLYIGSDLKVIINLFGVQQFYQIWKAILYQKRVVIFAHSSSSASSFIISLLTLFPGLSTFGIYSRPISKYMQGLREYALPLRLFNNDNFMSMSFHIQDFHLLSKFQKSNKGSFLLGTTNRLLKQANDYGIQMMINLQNCSVEKKKSRLPWQNLSKVQKKFISQIEQIIKMQKSSGYQGSEDMIRNKFHEFLKNQLLGIVLANKNLKIWTNNCKQYKSKNSKIHKKHKKDKNQKQNDYQQMDDEGQQEQQRNQNKTGQDFPPIIPSQITHIPFPGFLLTKAFPYFLQFHNQKINQILNKSVIPCLKIEGYDYTLNISNDEFISYNWCENKLIFGKGRLQSFQGKQIKLILQKQNNIAKNIFIGYIQNNKYHRNGFYLDKDQVYQGQYTHGCKQGYGKLNNSLHKYIGNFKQNLYQGQGQIVADGQIYVGQFKQGMKHGCGRVQGQINYEGQWQNNRFEGSGVMKFQDKQFIGRFSKGILDQNQQCTIRFQDGRIYKGQIKNKQPNGKGLMMKQLQTIFGHFQNGVLIDQIKKQQQVIQNIQSTNSQEKQQKQ